MPKNNPPTPIGAKYELTDGRIVFVKRSFMLTWKAFYRLQATKKNGKQSEKLVSLRAKCLPWRDTAEEAQADLDAAVASGEGVFKGAKQI